MKNADSLNGVRNNTPLQGGRAASDEAQTAPDSLLLLTACQAAAMLGMSERTWRTWDAMGRIPKSIRIGRKPFWKPVDIKSWVAAGCPDRETWEILQR